MKPLISIFSILAAALVIIFVAVPQLICTKETCSYAGIRALKTERQALTEALSSAQDLEGRRAQLTDRYNAVNPEDREKLEALLPNNVDNIKLVLELETLAKRYGLLIESPRLETQTSNAAGESGSSGQAIRGVDSTASLPYGTFTLDFTVRSTYENAKALLSDIEKNLRLIEPVSIVLRVPGVEENTKTPQKYPAGTYDITIKAVIYYLKN